MDYLISLHFISVSPLDLFYNHFSTHDQSPSALPSALMKVSNPCGFFPKNTSYYFSKSRYTFLRIVPLEVRDNCYHVSQVPTFSPKTESKLRCPSLGCEYEKKKQTHAWVLPRKLKFSQNFVFKLLCFLLLLLCNQGHLPFTITHDFLSSSYKFSLDGRSPLPSVIRGFTCTAAVAHR